jgi:hypothetical protein
MLGFDTWSELGCKDKKENIIVGIKGIIGSVSLIG